MSQQLYLQALETAKQSAALVAANPQVPATTQAVVPAAQGSRGPGPGPGR